MYDTDGVGEGCAVATDGCFYQVVSVMADPSDGTLFSPSQDGNIYTAYTLRKSHCVDNSHTNFIRRKRLCCSVFLETLKDLNLFR